MRREPKPTRLSELLVKLRDETGHNRLSVEQFSRSEAAKRGKDYFVHSTTLLNYERGGWPSPPKLLTLARAYDVPLGVLFRAIGASDDEICGHGLTAEQHRLIEDMHRPEYAEIFDDLRAILKRGGSEAKIIMSLIQLLADKIATYPRARVAGQLSVAESLEEYKQGGKNDPSEPKKPPASRDHPH